MVKSDNPYRSIEAEVVEVISESPTIKTIRFKPKEKLAFATGQFVEIALPGVGEAPFTPSSQPGASGPMEVTVMRVGKVTEKIHELKKGDTIGVRGPYGQGYPLDQYKGKNLVVVGGGVGLAPLRSLLYSLLAMKSEIKKLCVRFGARTPEDLIYKDELKEWAKRHDLDFRLTVDKGDSSWKGPVGLVTTILDDLPVDYSQAIAIVCGPPIMMKFTALKLLKLGFKHENTYLSMEKNMSCGIGKCGHCRLGTYYACKDGPVFTYDRIKNFPNIWD